MPSDNGSDDPHIRLRHDSDYERELNHVKRQTNALSKSADRGRWILSALVLAATVITLHSISAPEGLMVSATLAVSTVLLIVFVNRGFSDLHEDLTILVSVTEWMGKKQLGEIEETDQF